MTLLVKTLTIKNYYKMKNFTQKVKVFMKALKEHAVAASYAINR